MKMTSGLYCLQYKIIIYVCKEYCEQRVRVSTTVSKTKIKLYKSALDWWHQCFGSGFSTGQIQIRILYWVPTLHRNGKSFRYKANNIFSWNPDLVKFCGSVTDPDLLVKGMGPDLHFDPSSISIVLWFLYDLSVKQCCGSGSESGSGSTCFWASRIRIRIH